MDGPDLPSHVAGPSSPPLITAGIGRYLDELAAQQPTTEAVVSLHQAQRLTYAGLREESDTAAAALVSLGVRPGDRVGVWATSCVEWVVLQVAIAKIGGVLVSMNPAYRAHELAYAVARCGMSHLVMGQGYRDTSYVGLLDRVKREVPCLKHVVVLGSLVHNGKEFWGGGVEEFREKGRKGVVCGGGLGVLEQNVRSPFLLAKLHQTQGSNI